MQFQVTEDILDKISTAINENNIKWLEKQLKKLHSADIAEILNELNLEDGKKLYNFLEDKTAADALIEMEEDKRERFLESLTSAQIADHIDHLPSDEAADMIAELPDKIQDEVLRELEKDDAAQASDIVDLLKYDANTAGGLMQKELVKVNMNKNMIDCVRELRKHAEHIEDVYAVYVVDDSDRLVGVIPLKKILTTSLRTKISEVYEPEVMSVKTNMDAAEVAKIMEKYNFIFISVVDELGRLVGRITIDDVVDVMSAEAEKDIQMMSGITEDVEHTDKIWVLSRSRIPWLLVGLAGGILGARVIGEYEDQIRIYPEMAFFIPLIAAMGGNAGVQSSAIVVQAIANNSLISSGIFKKLVKEFMVGLLNGLICAVLILVYNFFFSESMALSITVSISLLSVIIFATVFGTFVPIVLDRYKVDPALATGPFITTTNDIFGLFIYFLLGRILYSVF